MIRPLALLGAIWLAVSSAAAQTPPAPPTREALVDAIFEKYDRSDSSRGARWASSRPAGSSTRAATGANLELKIANSPQTVFDIGSLGKQFTAFSIHLLARDGKLVPGDDIRKHLTSSPAFDAPVTIRHLLHHTGVCATTRPDDAGGRATRGPDDEQEALAVQARPEGSPVRARNEFSTATPAISSSASSSSARAAEPSRLRPRAHLRALGMNLAVQPRTMRD